VDVFLAQVERRSDGQLVGVLYQNGLRVRVHTSGIQPPGTHRANDSLGGAEQTAKKKAVPAVAVQHRCDRDPIAADQAQQSHK